MKKIYLVGFELSRPVKMPLSLNMKKLLNEFNVNESEAGTKLTQRGMHVMHAYVKLIFLRLQTDNDDLDRHNEKEMHLKKLLCEMQSFTEDSEANQCL